MSVSGFAIASRCPEGAIAYYFENKEKLYRAVMQRIGSQLEKAFEQLASEHLPADEALKEAIRTGISYGAAYPQRGMLWFYEAIQNQGKYGEISGWQQSFRNMTQILERGIAEGTFRQIDPFLTTGERLLRLFNQKC